MIRKLNWQYGRAKTPFGVYESLGEGRRWVFKFRNDPFVEIYRTKKAAQAAAQADFERRVRECLEGEQ